jgi:hypothetical protein
MATTFCELEGLASIIYFSVDRRMQRVIEELKDQKNIDVVRRDKALAKSRIIHAFCSS